MKEIAVGGVVVVVVVIGAMVWADSRNVVREHERAMPAIVTAIDDDDVAVPKPEPVATCPDDACTFSCRDTLSGCVKFMEETCGKHHPLPPGSKAKQLMRVTKYEENKACEILCPTASGGAQEYECRTQKEIDRDRPKPPVASP